MNDLTVSEGAFLWFGDYLLFHPHLHILAAAGLIDADQLKAERGLRTLKKMIEKCCENS